MKKLIQLLIVLLLFQHALKTGSVDFIRTQTYRHLISQQIIKQGENPSLDEKQRVGKNKEINDRNAYFSALLNRLCKLFEDLFKIAQKEIMPSEHWFDTANKAPDKVTVRWLENGHGEWKGFFTQYKNDFEEHILKLGEHNRNIGNALIEFVNTLEQDFFRYEIPTYDAGSSSSDAKVKAAKLKELKERFEAPLIFVKLLLMNVINKVYKDQGNYEIEESLAVQKFYQENSNKVSEQARIALLTYVPHSLQKLLKNSTQEPAKNGEDEAKKQADKANFPPTTKTLPKNSGNSQESKKNNFENFATVGGALAFIGGASYYFGFFKKIQNWFRQKSLRGKIKRFRGSLPLEVDFEQFKELALKNFVELQELSNDKLQEILIEAFYKEL